jgi:plastocyanin
MKLIASMFALVGIVSFAADITGTVTAPTAKPMPAGAQMAKADPNCPKTKAPNEVVQVQATKLQNAFVYVKGAAAGTAPATEATLDQLGCVYAPHAVGMMVGQSLKILNSDKTMHNVNAKSAKSQGFNAGMVAGAAPIVKKFTKPEFLKFKCDVHGWMNSVVGVFDHPHFAVTDKEVKFTITGVQMAKTL